MQIIVWWPRDRAAGYPTNYSPDVGQMVGASVSDNLYDVSEKCTLIAVLMFVMVMVA